MAMATMERVSVRIDEDDLERIDERVDRDQFPNRSEAIRAGIQLLEERVEMPSTGEEDGR